MTHCGLVSVHLDTVLHAARSRPIQQSVTASAEVAMMDFGLVVPLDGQFAYFSFDNQDGGEAWQGPVATFGTVKQVAGVGGTLDISENLAGVWVGYDGTDVVQYTQQSEEGSVWIAGPAAAAVSAAITGVPTGP